MKISKNCYRGDLITSLDELVVLADTNKSVWHTWWRLRPARVLTHMQINSIINSIKEKQLYRVINIKDINK